jgi:hypothetical protein
MSAFNYLTILTSIVLGLAIANVLNRLATVITARERVDFYWPPVAWGIWLFFISVQHWWAEWGVRHTPQWSFGADTPGTRVRSGYSRSRRVVLSQSRVVLWFHVFLARN